jgi:hypothetical protein
MLQLTFQIWWWKILPEHGKKGVVPMANGTIHRTVYNSLGGKKKTGQRELAM